MRIGYACLNRSLPSAGKTFRLASYSEAKFRETVQHNLDALQQLLEFNVEHNLLFHRISSNTIPFASHPIQTVDWQEEFAEQLSSIGTCIKNNGFRISMHPDQFVLINAKDPKIVEKSIGDLSWHADFLDALGLDTTAKIQIHVGGVYGDKEAAIARFVHEHKRLPSKIQRRLAIEHDDRLFSVRDCMVIHKQTGIPVIFDNLHHECLHNGETQEEAMQQLAITWKKEDGIPLVDYSMQAPGERVGKHAQTLDDKHFTTFIKHVPIDCDIMLEIKDKEPSAIRAKALC
ncbi:MAG: UV DNA damage repair endonuclease UvsE [Candidatus Woesearchaeota archaeon]|nr:UV DNA damage repair endonuclease UvsE [Candidatus Woesearchaeota archaeon]